MTLEELLRQGKSFGQGASNAAASTVTGPVDMLAWLLRKGGVPVGDTPIGGEAWMRQKGLMATPENRLAGLLGEGAGLAAPIVAAAKAPEIAGGLLQMGRNLAAPQTMNKQTGAIVYHGSPHKFDKFDSSKIGTGEGAQAYGHGLYLAESPDVAKGYSKMADTHPQAQQYLKMYQGDVNKAAAAFAKDVSEGAYGTKIKQEVIDDIAQSIKGRGSVYKVDLPDEHIAKMLDWDKPLSQQHPDVKSAIQKSGLVDFDKNIGPSSAGEIRDLGWSKNVGSLQGEELYRRLVENKFMQQKAVNTSARKSAEGVASSVLRDAGIPGIRYLDGGSRSAGAGSSNFVVFPGNEGLLKILERNGGKP